MRHSACAAERMRETSATRNKQNSGPANRHWEKEADGMRINPQERVYREAVLRDVKRHVAACGPHVARPHASRARQFMPFAALKGYTFDE